MNDMNSPPSIGLVGCGDWGRLILRDLVTLGCKVTVVARTERTRQNAEEYRADDIVNSTDDLGTVDGLVIATPATTHYEYITRLIGRGVPMFVEKPVVTDMGDALKLKNMDTSRLFVMHKWRYHRGVEALGDIVRNGEYGRVRGLRLLRLGWKVQERPEDLLWHLLPHDLSIIHEVLGRVPELRHVSAVRQQDYLTGACVSLGEDYPVVIEISEKHPEHHREVRLFTEQATVILPDSYSEELLIYHIPEKSATPQQSPEKRPFINEMPLMRELQAFINYLQGGDAPKSGFAEACESVSIIHECSRMADLQ